MIKLAEFLTTFIDFFYPPFRKNMSIQFFRYGVIGAANLVFDWVLYFVIYNFILQHRMVNLGFVTLSSHIAGLVFKLPFVLVSGFVLQRYVTFSATGKSAVMQFIRYLSVFIVNLVINYIGLKIMVDIFNLYPTPSLMLISVFTIGVSYISQKHFTFKV